MIAPSGPLAEDLAVTLRRANGISLSGRRHEVLRTVLTRAFEEREAARAAEPPISRLSAPAISSAARALLLSYFCFGL